MCVCVSSHTQCHAKQHLYIKSANHGSARINTDILLLSDREYQAHSREHGVAPAEHTPLSQTLRNPISAPLAARNVTRDIPGCYSGTHTEADASNPVHRPSTGPTILPPPEPLTLRLSNHHPSPPSRPPPDAPIQPVSAASGAPPIISGTLHHAPSNSGAPESSLPWVSPAPVDSSTPGSDVRLGQPLRSVSVSGGVVPSLVSGAPNSVSPVKPTATSQTPWPRNLDAYLPVQICEAYYGGKGPWPELYEWQV